MSWLDISVVASGRKHWVSETVLDNVCNSNALRSYLLEGGLVLGQDSARA